MDLTAHSVEVKIQEGKIESNGSSQKAARLFLFPNCLADDIFSVSDQIESPT
jgi:hypothetical protein